MIPYGLPPILPRLPTMESENFVIHFGLRNPHDGEGLGRDGVRDRVVVLTYLDALERLYEVMRGEPWNRDAPVTDRGGKTHVYVCNSEPFTADDPLDGLPVSRKVPYIILPSRSAETTTQAELHRAAAEAIHEATHVFNYSKRPFYEGTSGAWEWFDEGFAVFMETHVAAGNSDYFRYLIDWIDAPETPLDDVNAKYQAGMFIRYLAKKMGRKFVNDVWVDSYATETPLDTLKRMARAEGVQLVSPDPNVRDLFASGYCLDPYFIWDHSSACHAPDIFVRYGERAVTESFTLSPGQPAAQSAGVLKHLACRYYSFRVTDGVSNIKFELETEPPAGGVGVLKAEAAMVTKERTRHANVEYLRPAAEAGAGGGLVLSAAVAVPNPQALDHVVLVVSNCGFKPSLDDDDEGADDGKAYWIRATAS